MGWTEGPINLVLWARIDLCLSYTTGTAGIGGILCDDLGNLFRTFAAATVAYSALEAEMQAFLRGTQLC